MKARVVDKNQADNKSIQVRSHSNILVRLNNQPKEIQKNIMAYLTDDDYKALMTTCLQAFGGRNISFRQKYAKPTWDKMTEFASGYLYVTQELREALFISPFEENRKIRDLKRRLRGIDNTIDHHDIKALAGSYVLLLMMNAIGLIGTAPVLASYPIAGLASLPQYTMGALKDYQRYIKCQQRAISYSGVSLPLPSKTRNMMSEHSKKRKHTEETTLDVAKRQKQTQTKNIAAERPIEKNRFFTPSEGTIAQPLPKHSRVQVQAKL